MQIWLQIKLGIVKFLAQGVFNDEDILIHLIVAAADTRFSIANLADMELKKVIGYKAFKICSLLIYTLLVKLAAQLTGAHQPWRCPCICCFWAVSHRISSPIWKNHLRALGYVWNCWRICVVWLERVLSSQLVFRSFSILCMEWIRILGWKRWRCSLLEISCDSKC